MSACFLTVAERSDPKSLAYPCTIGGCSFAALCNLSNFTPKNFGAADLISDFGIKW
jgi:hypothetical protein